MPISRILPGNTATSSLPFHTSPATWRANIGFSPLSVTQWVNSRVDPFAAALSGTVDLLAGFQQEAVTYSSWEHARFQQDLLTSRRILAKESRPLQLTGNERWPHFSKKVSPQKRRHIQMGKTDQTRFKSICWLCYLMDHYPGGLITDLP